MPARGDIKPPEPPAKDTWLAACEAELVALRPHLATYGGKIKRTIALKLWGTHAKGAPEAAAREWHEAHPVQS